MKSKRVMPLATDQMAEFPTMACLARDEIGVFMANPTIALVTGLTWVRPMLRTA